MVDKNKVKKGLECCQDVSKSHCDGCPYDYNARGYLNECTSDLASDALALLNEKKTTKWISVEDKLPTYAELKTGYVLVLFEDGDICKAEFDECIENDSIFGVWKQNFDPISLGATDSDWIPFENVTHWMPIPKLP